MSRQTIFTEEPSKCFTGDDKQARPVKATHLVTYANFLTDDQDHSKERPFSYRMTPEKKKRVHDNERNIDRNQFPNNEYAAYPKKRTNEASGRNWASSYNILNFDRSCNEAQPSATNINRRPEKQASNLIGVGEPVAMAEVRPSRKVNPNRFSSQGARAAFTYI